MIFANELIIDYKTNTKFYFKHEKKLSHLHDDFHEAKTNAA